MVCVKCGKFLKIKQNGVSVEEGMPLNDGMWGPYKIWQADLWECRECGIEIISGFGHRPIAEHYKKEEYARIRRSCKPLVMVNDC